MRPVMGWVSSCKKGSELEIRLKTGPVITIPHRDDLRWGDSVRVFYDYERMRPGQIILLDKLHQMSEEVEATWDEEDHPWDEPNIDNILAGL
jgi:hypothetical protein